MAHYLMFDVGGTNIKAGILTVKGKLLDDVVYSFDAMAKSEKEAIFNNLASVIRTLVDEINETDITISGIGMAFPGPFDYEKGISKMKGLDKYDSIYGCDIKSEILKSLNKLGCEGMIPEDCPFLFLHDVEAFALGESYFGEAKDKERVMCLCVGTGAGSAFIENRQILSEKSDRIPEFGWIYNTPFKDGIIDDYISARGLNRLIEQELLEENSGAFLYEKANNGDVKAINVFKMFGENLCEAVLSFLNSFKPDGFILGGQISNSFKYFGDSLKKVCDERGIEIYLTAHTSKRVFDGLFAKISYSKNAPI